MVDSSNLYETWQLVCTQIKSYDSVNPVQVDAFFGRLQPQAISDGFLIVTADTAFIKDQVERRFMGTIQQALKDLFGIDYLVEIEVDPVATAAPMPMGVAAMTPPPSPTPAIPVGIPVAAMAASQPPMAEMSQVQPVYQQMGTPIGSTQPFAAVGAAPAGIAPVMPAAVGEPSFDAASQATKKNIIYPTTAGEEAAFVEQVRPSSHPHDRAHGRDQAVNNTALPASSLTFETFVVGASNKLAYSMAVAVAEEPGKRNLNPLFIYGRSGLGKTHLLRAIQNYIIATNPHMRVVYIDSSEFLSDYTSAVAAHDKNKDSYQNFQSRYLDADVLLIDDVQYFQGKTATVDIVFQLFNKLTDMGKQVVLSADRAPKMIDIDERYTSRFNSGSTADVQPPEIETKLGIIKGFIEEYKISENDFDLYVPEDIQMYIAEVSSSNVRELKSAVTKVISQITYFDNPDISLPDVRVLLENHFSSGAMKRVDVAGIQREVERYYKVSHADLVGKKRSRNITYARQIAMYLCRQMLDIPYNDIGKRFDRDHSSVMYSVGQVEKKLTKSRELQEEIELITKNIREN
ncbi:MAG: chromosomal replication initiator protein DnaA [Slackia sp.]|nr:chromosomal replication initiator protein DnaA [Slackia sp.]